jgi:hypothetical protein
MTIKKIYRIIFHKDDRRYILGICSDDENDLIPYLEGDRFIDNECYIKDKKFKYSLFVKNKTR